MRVVYKGPLPSVSVYHAITGDVVAERGKIVDLPGSLARELIERDEFREAPAKPSEKKPAAKPKPKPRSGETRRAETPAPAEAPVQASAAPAADDQKPEGAAITRNEETST